MKHLHCTIDNDLRTFYESVYTYDMRIRDAVWEYFKYNAQFVSITTLEICSYNPNEE